VGYKRCDIVEVNIDVMLHISCYVLTPTITNRAIMVMLDGCSGDIGSNLTAVPAIVNNA
jgi:hypothetical protein